MSWKSSEDILEPLNQPTFTYLQLRIEALEQGLNMFKGNNKETGTNL